jgi:tetratricopeptide (TPR) repeat protein
MQPPSGALSCDAHHPHYHYQASCYHLWHGEALRISGDAGAEAAYQAALFQDHLNLEARDWRQRPEGCFHVPRYDAHPLRDAPFRHALGWPESAASAPHDEAVSLLEEGCIAEALGLAEQALRLEATHANSFFLLGKCCCFLEDYAQACLRFQQSIRLAQRGHDLYHQEASAQHVARAERFVLFARIEEAIQDCTKALDLDRKNERALGLRAKLYRDKGNRRAAEADEAFLTPRPR